MTSWNTDEPHSMQRRGFAPLTGKQCTAASIPFLVEQAAVQRELIYVTDMELIVVDEKNSLDVDITNHSASSFCLHPRLPIFACIKLTSFPQRKCTATSLGT